MKIEYTKRYKNSLKKIKNCYEEKKRLENIIKIIKESDNYNSLKINTISIMYGFEELKYELYGYCSFNLNKNGGKVRFIISNDGDIVIAEYISTNHYFDFKRTL